MKFSSLFILVLQLCLYEHSVHMNSHRLANSTSHNSHKSRLYTISIQIAQIGKACEWQVSHHSNSQRRCAQTATTRSHLGERRPDWSTEMRAININAEGTAMRPPEVGHAPQIRAVERIRGLNWQLTGSSGHLEKIGPLTGNHKSGTDPKQGFVCCRFTF